MGRGDFVSTIGRSIALRSEIATDIGSKWFSTLDLESGYCQVEMDPVDAENTTFCTNGGGSCQWNVLPFGLTSARATFERLMEWVLFGLHWKCCLV